MQKRTGEIPVAPIRRHLQRWIDSQGYNADESNLRGTPLTSPTEVIVTTLWPEMSVQHGRRLVYRLLHEQESIGFDLADKIIVDILGEPELWIIDSDLAESYADVDFRTVEAARPTCDSVREEIEAEVVAVFRDTHSINAVRRQTGIAFSRIKTILESHQELACA